MWRRSLVSARPFVPSSSTAGPVSCFYTRSAFVHVAAPMRSYHDDAHHAEEKPKSREQTLKELDDRFASQSERHKKTNKLKRATTLHELYKSYAGQIHDAENPNASVEVLFGESADQDSEYWADDSNWDSHDYLWKCRVEALLYERLGLPRSEHEKFRADYDISQGYTTLEWVLPSPPPEHTFDELPIIKVGGTHH
eukprot:TRINITY_DN13049_c0_g1_i1.p1 TRINITY_DN13049_c0_g1~~TRINITY_DN13049_c0_g1_i1.p1  ORF type:complete len:207 (-),score=29.65 TRINITY_DN13049_c0_g1_i1:173-760(-)